MHPILLKVKKTNSRYTFWLTAIIAVLLMAGCGGGSGGSSGGGTDPITPTGELQVAIDSVEVVDCEEIWVFFNVVGPDDNVVLDLTEDAITLLVDGTDVVGLKEFHQRTPVDKPISIVFVMDYSGSMPDEAIDRMKLAVEGFLTDMQDSGQEVWGSIIKFGGTISASGDLTDNIQDLLDYLAIDFPGSRNATNINDAVYKAIEDLNNPRQTERVAVILLTDGQHNVDLAKSLAEVIAHAQDNQVPIYSIGLMDRLDIFTEGPIKQMANETNGLYFRTPSNELSEKYQQTSRFLLFESNLVIFSKGELSYPDDPHEVKLLVSLGALSDWDEMEFDFDAICQ